MTTFTAPPNTPASSTSTMATVVITDDGKGNITNDRTPINAGPPCTLKATLDADGKSTTLLAGQTCLDAAGNTITYTSGGSTSTGATTYTSQSAFTVSGTTKTGAPLMGTGTAMSTCTKM